MRRGRVRRRRIASPILAGLVLVFMAAAAMPTLTRVPVRLVKIEGTLQHLTEEEIEKLVTPYMAWGWVRLPADRLRARLERENWVASAEIRREWPLDVAILIAERRAVARWDGGGLLDENAEIFDPGAPVDQSLPLLRGPKGTEQEMLDGFRSFSARLGTHSLALDELQLDPRGAWTLVLRNGPKLRLGSESIDLRLERALLVFHRIAEEPGKEMAYLDLRYPNGFAVGRQTPNTTSHKRGGASP